MRLMRNGKKFSRGATYQLGEKRKPIENAGHANPAINEIHNNPNLSRAEKIAAAKAILNKSKEAAAAKKANADKSKVCIIANKLAKQGLDRSQAFKKAWAIVKAGTVEAKVAGVTFGNRQKALERLTHYEAEQINISLTRETENPHDNNAVAVTASVTGKGSYTIGYLNKQLAAIIAPLIDCGKAVTATFKEVRGKYHNYHNYGLAVAVSI